MTASWSTTGNDEVSRNKIWETELDKGWVPDEVARGWMGEYSEEDVPDVQAMYRFVNADSAMIYVVGV